MWLGSGPEGFRASGEGTLEGALLEPKGLGVVPQEGWTCTEGTNSLGSIPSHSWQAGESV